MLSLRFEQPLFLLLALLAIPLIWLGWRAMVNNTDALRRNVALSLRTLLLLMLAFMLAGPHYLRQHDQLTVIGLLDISGSVQRFANLGALDNIVTNNAASPLARRSNIEYLRQWFRQATQTKLPDDRFGLVVFDGRAIAVSAPTTTEYVDDNLDTPISPGTNIAEAVRLGLAMFPADTAKRLVLVTDGNETDGNVLEAVRQAAGAAATNIELTAYAVRNRRGVGVPIDVVPIAYNVTNDVQIARIEAPPTALPGQTVTVRIILEAASPTAGWLTLRREGEPVDLNPQGRGAQRYVELPAGQSVHLAQVTLGETPINRFEAIFEAADPTQDVLPENNRAEAFTATPSKGSVLVLDSQISRRPNMLVQLFEAADLPAEARLPAQLPDDLLSLQNFDLIVLDNVAAYELSSHQQSLLARYVHDLGGGLIMVGGDNSFGAGGWNNTPVASILPLNLDPAKELRLPTAALVLVLDRSGSMTQPVAGARASQQEVANEACALAIESLRAESLVGVVTFSHSADVYIPLQPNDNPRELSQRVRAITPGGGTHFTPALHAAHQMLRDLPNVDTKRVVFISDGESADSHYDSVVAEMVADGIQVTTVAVGDYADHAALEAMAQAGNGEFFAVRDPRTLPRVLVESVRVINKPLIKESPFVPVVLPTGSTLTAGMEAAPPLQGIVITSPLDDPKVFMEMLHPDGEPLLAHWQAGLGRVAAFTSDAGGPWSQRWDAWPTANTFWTQLARMIARPAMSQDAELIATVRDDQLHIHFELLPTASAEDGSSDLGSFEYLQVEGAVYLPDGSSQPVRLRQGAPGRYEAIVDAPMAGNYIVALNPRQGSRQLAPVIGGASRATSPEFRRYRSNLGLLEEIVDLTGGRRLRVEDPLAVDLFDRAGMPPSVSLLPAWRTLLWWTIALLLLDVACRRIAWDYNLVRGFVLATVARVTPAHMRGERAAATLSSLRKVSDDVDRRQAAEASGIKKFQTTGIVAPPPPRFRTQRPAVASGSSQEQPPGAAEPGQAPASLQPRKPADAESSKIAAALNALSGRGEQQPQSASPSSPPASPSSPSAPASAPASGAHDDDDDAAASSTASYLRAAKLRARRKMQGEE